MNLERKFSKELAPDLRKETADKIREARNKPSNFDELKKYNKNVRELPEEYESWAPIKESFESLKKDIWGKIFKTEKYRERELFLNEVLSLKKEGDITRAKMEYEEKLNEIIKNCPLSIEEREKYLSTEAMEKMPLEDYLTLLKRLSGEAFYHVTRYGVRENTFMSTGGGHTLGKGTFINSLNQLLEDGNINSLVAREIKNDGSYILKSHENEIKEEIKKGTPIKEIVDHLMKQYDTEYFLDRESAHFSYGQDKHSMYGAEKGYKFYVYYPVEYILQNDFFHKNREVQIKIGESQFFNRGGIDQQYNDVEIFNFGKGVPVNAGILCITGDVDVDPKTGSQYLIENGEPVVDKNGEFKKPDQTITSQEYWENYFKINPELRPSKIIYSDFGTSSNKLDHVLSVWAESKKILNQDPDKKEAFDNYVKFTQDALRKIYTDIITEDF